VSPDPTKLPGFEDSLGVHFPMRNGNISVRVLVTRAALQGEGAPPAQGQYMARFKAFRNVYEAIAREKFGTGQCKASMAIELADLAKYLTRARTLTSIGPPIIRLAFQGLARRLPRRKDLRLS
jgi:hypothetical protein